MCSLDDMFQPIALGHLQVYNYVTLKQTNICNACQNALVMWRNWIKLHLTGKTLSKTINEILYQ
jgi:hypothetical protein